MSGLFKNLDPDTKPFIELILSACGGIALLIVAGAIAFRILPAPPAPKPEVQVVEKIVEKPVPSRPFTIQCPWCHNLSTVQPPATGSVGPIIGAKK